MFAVDLSGKKENLLALSYLLENGQEVGLVTTVFGGASPIETASMVAALSKQLQKEVAVYPGRCSALFAGAEEGHTPAATALAQFLLGQTEPVTIVTLGPLTNLALCLLTTPECKEKVAQVVAAGGSTYGGEVTTAAEVNIYADPEAARVVLEAGVPVTLCTIDPLRDLADDAMAALCKKYQSHIVGSLPGFSDLPADSLPKAYLVLDCLLCPTAILLKRTNVVIDLDGEATRGSTVCDIAGKSGNAPNCTVVLAYR